ncbi:Zinc finger, PHD-type [Corchorus olitorius]|uniref:Zinc finger, PHD-type n=1 Tax=Corchorus olitorius TaxID=93759 RepID=A0A1R3JNY0_9ROSI|nr:Zinc finger, PHD-type [Corchorus olitorius]
MARQYLVKHEHPLVFQEGIRSKLLERLGGIQLGYYERQRMTECRECLEPILEGPGFMCEYCGVGFHKKCAERPHQIFNHPFHGRYHDLFLKNYGDTDWICTFCGEACEKSFYGCKFSDAQIHYTIEAEIIGGRRKSPFLSYGYEYDTDCKKFYLHTDCALLPRYDYLARKPVQHKHKDHHHPLAFVQIEKPLLKKACNSCSECLMGCIFVCVECQFYLHIDCALGLADKINHPCHRKHHLTLHIVTELKLVYCKICQTIDKRSLFYRCSPCNFDLHTECVSSPSHVIDNGSHEHPFTCLLRQQSFVCDACGTQGDGAAYQCLTCNLLVHKKCISLPRTFKITRHHHLLSHNYFLEEKDFQSWECKICHEKVNSEHGSYSCSDCNYVVHVNCAKKKEDSDGLVEAKNKDVKKSNDRSVLLLDESTPFIVIKKEHSTESVVMIYLSRMLNSILIRDEVGDDEFQPRMKSLNSRHDLIGDDGSDEEHEISMKRRHLILRAVLPILRLSHTGDYELDGHKIAMRMRHFNRTLNSMLRDQIGNDQLDRKHKRAMKIRLFSRVLNLILRDDNAEEELDEEHKIAMKLRLSSRVLSLILKDENGDDEPDEELKTIMVFRHFSDVLVSMLNYQNRNSKLGKGYRFMVTFNHVLHSILGDQSRDNKVLDEGDKEGLKIILLCCVLDSILRDNIGEDTPRLHKRSISLSHDLIGEDEIGDRIIRYLSQVLDSTLRDLKDLIGDERKIDIKMRLFNHVLKSILKDQIADDELTEEHKIFMKVEHFSNVLAILLAQSRDNELHEEHQIAMKMRRFSLLLKSILRDEIGDDVFKPRMESFSDLIGDDEFEVGQKIATVIRHFSHVHDLNHSLILSHEIGQDACCHSCMLSISRPLFYGCSDCGFFLHKSCAELPRQKYHWLHKHRLTLYSDTIFKCNWCYHECSGFSYYCRECDVNLCLSCEGISEDRTSHPGHQHPLFFYEKQEGKCNGCGNHMDYVFKCKSCSFALDIQCLTLPHSVRYKSDPHPLTLTYHDHDDNLFRHYCDICEGERDPNLWYYHCAICETSVHPKCALGNHPFIKPGGYYRDKHPHLLKFVKKVYYYPKCFSCGQHCLDLALECAEFGCNYIVHWECIKPIWLCLEGKMGTRGEWSGK